VRLAKSSIGEYKANMASPLPNVAQLQYEIEGALARHFAGALSPRIKSEQERVPIGIAAVDELLGGGLPFGSLSELVGTESSGRTTVAMSLLAQVTSQDSAAAWVDGSDAFDPESAARCGVDLRRLLWVRCPDSQRQSTPEVPPQSFLCAGIRAASQQVPRSGGSPHPRSEIQGMPDAVASLLQAQPRSAAIHDRRARRIVGTPGAPNRPLVQLPQASPYREEQIPTDRMPARRSVAQAKLKATAEAKAATPPPAAEAPSTKPYYFPKRSRKTQGKSERSHDWNAIDRALKATDLLLQAGGFSLLILDLGSVPAEMAWRIPLSTWFRFRAACERTRTTMVLLTQHACAKSSASMLLKMHAGEMQEESGVLTGVRISTEVERERNRSAPASNVVSIRKPPQSERDGIWHARPTWAVGQ
jgi:recombination protein RecA